MASRVILIAWLSVISSLSLCAFSWFESLPAELHARPLIRGEFQGHSERLCENCESSETREKEPSLQYEQLRRQVESDVHFTLERVNSELSQLNSSNVSETLLQDLEHQLRVTANDLARLSEADELHEWREKEAAALSALIQHRLHVLQNPTNCESAKKVYCFFGPKQGRGIGSLLHHLSYCFLAAYGTQRTLILNTTGFYGNPRGLDTFFLPLSDTCTTVDTSQVVPWPGTEDSATIEMPSSDRVNPRPNYFPRGVPRDISDRLRRLHGNPFAWWMGQFFKYAFRMNKDFKEYIGNLSETIGFQAPIVGIHVRRTDKINREARYIPIEDYMKGAEHFYDDLEMREPVSQRRIFLATDDPSLIPEIKEKYPTYVLLSNEDSIQSAQPRKRKEGPNLRFFMADIFFLSRSNFLVCGMSSNVCRVAYEVMQSLHPDASTLAWTVDVEYRFHSEKAHYVRVRYPHPQRREEMELYEGDLIQTEYKYFAFQRNNKNGLHYGLNKRTHNSGLYPAYKTVDVVDVADDVPSFSEIDLRNTTDMQK